MSAVLVTGAAKRLGRAIALRLARDGYDVAIHYRSSRAEADALAAENNGLGRRTARVDRELSKEAEVATIVQRV